MKPKQSKKMRVATSLVDGWIDVDELVKPGEIKEIAPGLWVNNTMVVLDPPEPIKKASKSRPKKK